MYYGWLKSQDFEIIVSKLLEMEDPFAPPIGTLGTVIGVDDIGSILVSWDNGQSLNVLYGIDKIMKLE